MSLDSMWIWQVQVSVYCAQQIPVHLRCTQCSILVYLIDIFFLTCICLWQISQIQIFLGVVVGPGLVCSEEIVPHLTCRTLAQLRTNKSPFLKSYLHNVNAKSHPSLLCPLCNTHIHNTHHIFHCTHIHTILSPLDLWTWEWVDINNNKNQILRYVVYKP